MGLGNNSPHASVWDDMYGNNGDMVYHDITSNNILTLIKNVYDGTIGRYFGVREIEGKSMFRNLPKGYNTSENTPDNSVVGAGQLYKDIIAKPQNGGGTRRPFRIKKTRVKSKISKRNKTKRNKIKKEPVSYKRKSL
jgi:hypothetical protein